MSITLPPLPQGPYSAREMNVYATAAIEADRASRVSMTDMQIGEAMCSVDDPLGWGCFVGNGDVFKELLMQFVRAVEKHHGIGAKL